jgi:hypothetical protein
VTADWENIKYNPTARYALQRLLDVDAALDLPPSCKDLLAAEARDNIHAAVHASVAKSTWQKYSSGWAAFCAFELYYETSFSWPLSKSCWRLFVNWCLTVKKLQPSSTRTYISALKFVHHIKDVTCLDPKQDPLLGMILKGSSNRLFATAPRPSTRRVIQLPLLIIIGDRIRRTQWSDLTKQVVWTACTVAFFSSARLGELLSSTMYKHDPTADLLWSDVNFPTPDSVLIRLKCAKSGEIQGEFLDLFPFLGFDCCPVASMKKMLQLQQEVGSYSPDLPCFRFASGKNLTPCQFNCILSNILSDFCLPGENTISCHSFRAGIPSTLALFPELTNSDDIKGWGRWHSDCYTRYTRLRHEQKKAIFSRITAALLASPPSD